MYSENQWKKHFQGYVFDLDGTLFRIGVDWAKVRSKVGAIIGRSDEFPIFPTLEKTLALQPELKPQLFALLDSEEMLALDSVEPVEGALKIVKSLTASAKVGMVTMQGRRICHSILKHFNVFQDFDIILTREDSLNRRIQIELAIDGLKLSPEDTLVVGDKISDGQAAVDAGASGVVVGKGSGEIAHNGKRFLLTRNLLEIFGNS
ncbi:MAG: HAD hydrolase-like protein [Thermoprotei archaeon]